MKIKIKDITIPILLWNPITLALLSKSVSVAILLTVFVVVIWCCVHSCKSLRLKVWMFNLCAFGSIFYHAELLFRTFAQDKDIPNLYELHGDYYFNKPFLTQKFTNEEFVSHYNTNCQGYRIDALTNPNDSLKDCDWLFVGDSFTQGAQVDYSDLFSSQIYKNFPNKIIVNAGISGAGLYDELAYFKEKGKDLHPKVVFLQIGVFNDFFNIQRNHAKFQDYLTQYSSLYRFFAYNVLHTEYLPIGRWTEPIFPNVQDNIDGDILYTETSAVKESDKQAFQECIASWKEVVESNGGKLVLLLIPSKEQTSDKMFEEVCSAYKLDKSKFDMTYPSRFCSSVADKLGIQLVDLYGDFRTSEIFPFFLHDEHLNAHGHKLIANKLSYVFTSEAGKYMYFSRDNRNERYPTVYSDGEKLLYQYQEEDHYHIASGNIDGSQKDILWKSVQELVHPSFSSNKRYLVFTEGNQELSRTNVIVYDTKLQKSWQINNAGTFGSIPSFNNSGTRVVYAAWNKNRSKPYVVLYDILQKRTVLEFEDGVECWRPIFLSDNVICYISKKTSFSNFIVKSYDVETRERKTILSQDFNIWDIAVSPSKRYLAFAGYKNKNWDIFQYDMLKRSVHQLTNSKGQEWDPAYGVTDSDLWFAGTFGINNGIYRLSSINEHN